MSQKKDKTDLSIEDYIKLFIQKRRKTAVPISIKEWKITKNLYLPT